jgi:CRP-like cAMP-binding protein
VVGIGNAVVDVSAFTVVTRLAGPRAAGKVLGVLEFVALAGLATGSILTPLLLHVFGVRGTLALLGGGLVGLALAHAVRFRRLDRAMPVPGPEAGLLGTLPMFAPLPLAVTNLLAAEIEPRQFPAGAVVMCEGEAGDQFHLIVEGSAAVSVRGARHPDEQVVSVIEAVFTQFAVAGSARQVWLWLKDQHLSWPLQQIGYRRGSLPEITWVEPTYHAVHTTLTHPAYAGAYVCGRSRQEHYLGEYGTLKKRRRVLPQDQWEVLIPGHHEGFTDWDTYQANQARLAGNIRPRPISPAPSRSGRAAPCARAWPSAGTAAGNWPSTTTGRPSLPPATAAGAADIGRGCRQVACGRSAHDTNAATTSGTASAMAGIAQVADGTIEPLSGSAAESLRACHAPAACSTSQDAPQAGWSSIACGNRSRPHVTTRRYDPCAGQR